MNNAGEILPGHSVTEIFRAETDYLCGVSVLIATYGRERRTSDLQIEIVRIEGDVSCLAAINVNLSEVYDNSYVDLLFAPEEESKGKEYLVRIGSSNAEPGNAATVYLTDGMERIGGHLGCHGSQAFPGAVGVVATLAFAPPLSDSSIPPNLAISPVTQCNLNCVHCISRDTRASLSRLPAVVRARISEWAKEGQLKTAYTDYSGDIVWADKKYGGELDFLIGLSVPFHVDTNGTHMDTDSADRLFGSKVTSINVSIDAARDATYRRIRRGAPSLDTILQNMRLLTERRAASARMDVQLSGGFVLMQSNIEELTEFVRLVQGVGFDAVRTIHMQAYTPDMEQESLWYAKERFNQVRTEAIAQADDLGITLYIDRAFEDRADRVATSFCSQPWTGAYLLGNGDVLACCVPGAELRMGNLHRQTMEDIWNGPEYRSLRRRVNSNHRPAPCTACPFHRKTNNPLSYMPFKALQERYQVRLAPG